MRLDAGRLVEARYRIRAEIGQGAFGVVYQADALPAALADHGMRKVALKVLTGEHAAHPDALARFTHEAYLAARLRHPNLVPVVDYGALEDGSPYYAMELLRGATLDRVLESDPILPTRLVARFVDDCAQALAALHAHGIVHRDVKPANLFVEVRQRRPHVRLLDLGVAGTYDAKRARSLAAVDVGAAGTPGTPAYIAPEQALGKKVGPRADVYGLACVTYRMLTGAQPFAGGSITQMVYAHLFHQARPPSRLNPTLPAALDQVIERALEKDPAQRTPTVARFAAELRVALR